MWWLKLDDKSHVFIIVDGLPATRKNGEKCDHVVKIKASNSREKIRVEFKGHITSTFPRNKFQPHKNPESKLFENCTDNTSFIKVFEQNFENTNSSNEEARAMETEVLELDKQVSSKLIDEGIFLVNIEQMNEPTKERKCRSVDEKFVNLIKEGLQRSNVSTYTPVFPVLCTSLNLKEKDQFDKGMLDTYVFETLGGNHLIKALKALREEGKQEFSKQYVKIYIGLTDEECVRVASDHNTRTQLQRETSFIEEASLCRRMILNPPEDNTTPLDLTKQWRETSRILLCREQQSLQALDTCFQVAGYSARCWEMVQKMDSMSKAGSLKGQKEKKSKKPLSQTAFTYIKGISEEDKFKILNSVCKGEISVSGMKREADLKKKQKEVKQKMVEFFDVSSWEDLETDYPYHTREKDIEQLCALSYPKEALPSEFIRHCESAKRSNDNNLEIEEIDIPKEMFGGARAVVATYSSFSTLKHLDAIITVGDHAFIYICFHEKNSNEFVKDLVEFVLKISGDITVAIFGNNRQLAEAELILFNASYKTESFYQFNPSASPERKEKYLMKNCVNQGILSYCNRKCTKEKIWNCWQLNDHLFLQKIVRKFTEKNDWFIQCIMDNESLQIVPLEMERHLLILTHKMAETFEELRDTIKKYKENIENEGDEDESENRGSFTGEKIHEPVDKEVDEEFEESEEHVNIKAEKIDREMDEESEELENQATLTTEEIHEPVDREMGSEKHVTDAAEKIYTAEKIHDREMDEDDFTPVLKETDILDPAVKKRKTSGILSFFTKKS